MAWSAPGAGELRARVRFERRGAGENVGGVVKRAWATLIPTRAARLLPLQGGERVQGDRLAGISAWELTIRRTAETAELTTDDRVVDARDDRKAFAIRAILDLEARGRWIVLTLELGAEDAA